MTTEPLYWIELSDGELWLANDHADLVAGFFMGYLTLSSVAREAARRAYAASTVRDAQQRLFAQAVNDGTADIETIPDDVVDRLLGEGAVGVGEPWDFEPIPLVVLAGASADWQPPAGNVIVFDARQDGSFLLSLSRTGEIRSLGLLTGRALLAHPLGL